MEKKHLDNEDKPCIEITTSTSSSADDTIHANEPAPTNSTLNQSDESIDIQYRISDPIPLGNCTIKEIITEIMDCKIIREPGLNTPHTTNYQHNRSEDENLPQLLTPSRTQQIPVCTMKDIIGRIMDYRVCPSDHSNPCRRLSNESTSNDLDVDNKSLNIEALREMGVIQTSYKIFRYFHFNSHIY